MGDLGLEAKLSTIGLGKDEFAQALRTLKAFVVEGGYYPSTIDEAQFDESAINEIYGIFTDG